MGRLRCLILLPLLLWTSSAGPAPQQMHRNVNDLVEYWAAAHLFLHGGDPYAGEAVLSWERQAGFTRPAPLIMRNPPWIMPVILIFGLLPFAAAQQIWFGLSLIAVLVSARWLWKLYSEEGQSLWIAWLVTGLFLPVAVSIAIGQISPLVLLGITGFLHSEKHDRLIWAGVFLFLVALKPHLVFLLWIALLLWSLRTRSARTLAAFATVAAVASAIALAIDPSIFAQYFNFFRRDQLLAEVTPTLSGMLGAAIGHSYFLRSLPELLALAWFLFYWRRIRVRWDWRWELPLLLIVSLLTISYGWFFDQIILLPCAFQAAAWLARSSRLVSVILAALYLVTNAAVLALITMHRTTFWYVWTVPAWFALYAFIRAKYGRWRPSVVLQAA
jgi:Glycosyltransferase family 87